MFNNFKIVVLIIWLLISNSIQFRFDSRENKHENSNQMNLVKGYSLLSQKNGLLYLTSDSKVLERAKLVYDIKAKNNNKYTSFKTTKPNKTKSYVSAVRPKVKVPFKWG